MLAYPAAVAGSAGKQPAFVCRAPRSSLPGRTHLGRFVLRIGRPRAIKQRCLVFPVAMSNQPDAAVYTGPNAVPRGQLDGGPRPRVTLRLLAEKYGKGIPLTMVTAYDYPSAVHVDAAGIDLLLVGDSAAMVVHGHDTTLPITLDDMLLHCRAVARGARGPLLVGDLPFGSYEAGPTQAVSSGVRMLKEGGVDAVKLEGGTPARVEAAAALVGAGIAVMGHVGLTPQSISVLGGFRPQGRTSADATSVLTQALALEAAGVFAIVLECVPAPVAAAVTRALRVPTIGIGAGPHTSGQVLVYHDLLGMMSHPHHAKVTPKFCKSYARVGAVIATALSEYVRDVTAGTFPDLERSPYTLEPGASDELVAWLHTHGHGEAAEAAAAATRAGYGVKKDKDRARTH